MKHNVDLIDDKTSPYYFGEEMSDGRLTAEYDNTIIPNFRELVRKRTELGRPLTEEEMRRFGINE